MLHFLTSPIFFSRNRKSSSSDFALACNKSMAGASGVAGVRAAAPCALCPAPAAPVVVRKKLYVPSQPFLPLSQRKIYVKIHEMCRNTA